ncbi:N-acetylmannosamine-6-phosphate 2-epimerase, partial [bacterium]
MTLRNFLARLERCRLVASVQGSEKSPTDHPETLARLARASVHEGVQILRLEGVKNIRTIKPILPLVTIGLLKRQYPGSDVYITPTKQDADSLIDLGCEVVAFDATSRPRPKGTDLPGLIEHINRRKTLSLADCDTPEAAEQAAAYGASMISTTLGGYTPGRERTEGPDLELLREIVRRVDVPV